MTTSQTTTTLEARVLTKETAFVEKEDRKQISYDGKYSFTVLCEELGNAFTCYRSCSIPLRSTIFSLHKVM
jgi:hypothetical protein